MARDQSALVNWSQYLALRGVNGFIQSFHVEQNLATAAAVGSVFYKLNRKRRERTAHHIAQSYPEWNIDQVEYTALRSMQHMFKLFMVESFVAPRLITPSTWSSYLKLGDLRPLLNMLVQQEPAIFVTGHFGNWELLGTAMAAIGYPFIALARPLDNPLINKWLFGLREVRGMKIITKWGATSVLQDTLRDGGRVGFIADQNAGDQGMFVPFFGRLASTYKSIGLLAMRYNVPIVAGSAVRLNDRFHYEIAYADIIRPEDWADRPDPLFYITARYTRAIESMVRSAPDQYLWIHRRWKSRPKHEREREPMPHKLIEKLEQLPWMTQDELSRLVKSASVHAA